MSDKVMEQTVERELHFKLTAEEKSKMADTAASLSYERDKLMDELKAIGKTMRADIKQNQREIDRLLYSQQKGIEVRNVKVKEELDWENSTVKTFYKGELWDTREMMDHEKQMKLDVNATRKVKKGAKDKRVKADKNPTKHLTPEEQGVSEIAEVHSLETKRKTKKSSVDANH